MAPAGLLGQGDQWPPLPPPANAGRLLDPAQDLDLGAGADFLLDPGPVILSNGVPGPMFNPKHNHSPSAPLRSGTRLTR